MPIAHSEYPAKSKNIWPENAKTPVQASSGSSKEPELKTLSDSPLNSESAKTVFSKRPIVNNSNPRKNWFSLAFFGS